MASLDNFNTPNGGQVRMSWPDEQTRMSSYMRGVQNTSTHGDVASHVPVGPIQPSDQAIRLSDHPDPRYTEKVSSRLDTLYVPTRPYTERMKGDTAEANLLYERRCCPLRRMWQRITTPVDSTHMVALKTRNNRYQPY